MSFKMKYPIKTDYLPKGTKKRPGNNINVGFVVGHDSGNPGSTAAGNVNYYKNNANADFASAQIFVDDTTILECIPALTGKPERAYHVIYDVTTDNIMYGDDANDIAIGVEYCWGGKINAEESYKRYVWVIAYICYKFNLNPAKAVVGHKILDPGRKIDPDNGLSKTGKSYAQLLKDVVTEYNECAQAEVKVAAASTSVYKIKKGDTFWSVANANKMDVKQLMALNPSVDPTKLQIGQAINLKKAEAPKPPAPAPKPVAKKAAKPVRPYPGIVKLGSKGRDVEAIQRALGFSGHAVDGVFGRNTQASVIGYQKRKGLVADGIVGEKTWNVMF
jgi:N-acetylmuramoyl-L-alanine amidase